LSDFGSFAIDQDDGVGLKLRDHMIALLTANLDQLLCPIPAIGQKVEPTRDGKLKIFYHFLCNRYLGSKAAASLGRVAMIEPDPKGQEKVSVKQCGKYPLMAEDVGHILSMILVPRASRDLFSTLLSNGVIDDKKNHATGLDSERIEEPPQGDLHELLLSPGVFRQKSGEA
jgi:hypothetical protein